MVFEYRARFDFLFTFPRLSSLFSVAFPFGILSFGVPSLLSGFESRKILSIFRCPFAVSPFVQPTSNVLSLSFLAVLSNRAMNAPSDRLRIWSTRLIEFNRFSQQIPRCESPFYMAI